MSLELNEISKSLSQNLNEKERIQTTLDSTINSFIAFKKKALKEIEELDGKLSDSLKNSEKK